MSIATALPARHLVLVLVICLSWAFNFLASAQALRHFPPFLFTALRLAVVLLCLLPWLALPPPGQRQRLLAVGFLNGALHFGLNFWALQLAGDVSSNAIALQSYIPMSALLAVWLLGERIGWRTITGITVAFAGVVVLGFDPLVVDEPAALLLCLVSAFCLALGTTLMRHLKGVGTLNLQAWNAVIGLPALFLAVAVLEPEPWPVLLTASWVDWGGVLYSALIASIVGHGLLYYLIQRHPVSLVTPYLLLTPVFAVTLGVLVWGDKPGPKLIIGGAMVLGGVLVVALRAISLRRPMPEPSD